MSDVRLIRRKSRFERNFTQIANSWLRDSSISYRARGLLAAVWSFPDGWKVLLKDLAADSPKEGIDAIRSAVAELEQAGYLRRVPRKGVGAQNIGHDWEVSDPHEVVTDSNQLAALDNPMRPVDNPITALDYPTRTALDNPTPIETHIKHLNKVTNLTTDRAREKELCVSGHQLIDGYCEIGCKADYLQRERKAQELMNA